MTNISKHALDPKQLADLFGQMERTIGKLTCSSSPEFLSELLGEEERIMLAKRLAAVIMCIEGNTSYRIWNTLKMSPSTAENIRGKYDRNEYQNIERILKKNRIEYQKFCHALEMILSAGFSPRGRSRWKRTTRLLTQK